MLSNTPHTRIPKRPHNPIVISSADMVNTTGRISTNICPSILQLIANILLLVAGHLWLITISLP
jgi:hypothetical protein